MTTRACSTLGGGVMFVPDAVERLEAKNKKPVASKSSPASFVSYAALAGTVNAAASKRPLAERIFGRLMGRKATAQDRDAA